MITTTPQLNQVEILWAEKINPKLAGIVDKMINFPNVADQRPCEYNALNRVVFEYTDRPRGKTGMYVNGDIVINLVGCFQVAKNVSEDDFSSPVIPAAWDVMLRSLFHELFHAWVDSSPDLAFDDEALEEEEANNFADRQLVRFSLHYDVEMPPAKEMGLFYELALDWLAEKSQADPADEWVMTQRQWLKDGTVFVFSDAPVVSYRQYMRVIAPFDVQQSDRWDEDGKPVWKVINADTEEEVQERTNAFTTPEEEATLHADEVETPPGPPTGNVPTPPPPGPSAPVPPVPPAAVAPANVPTPPPVSTTTIPAANATEEEPVYDEDTRPEPDFSEYEQPSEVHHAYTPITAPTNLEAHQIPMHEMVSSMQAIYMRLNQVFYDKCGWNGVGSFDNPAGVLDGVSIADIPHARELVSHCETTNQLGQRTMQECNGFVRGTVFAKKGLPAFILYLNINGIAHKRVLVVQNPTTGSYSAKDVQRGSQIAWVLNGDLSDMEIEKRRAAGQKASKFVAKIKDGKYIPTK